MSVAQAHQVFKLQNRMMKMATMYRALIGELLPGLNGIIHINIYPRPSH